MNDEKIESPGGVPDDVGELKREIARAGEGPDTTGHLVFLAILVIVFSVISGYAQAAATVLGSLRGGDPFARAVYYPQFLLDVAEVYGSYPNFTSGIGLYGGLALLALSLYSLFRRYKAKWISYLLGIAFIGFYVNVLAWLNDAPAEILLEDLSALTPGAYHVILGGLLFMLFGMWVGEKIDPVRAFFLLILGTFVIFEIQFSLRAMQVVNAAVEESWTTLPEMSFLYSALGGIVMSLLVLGGALLLIESLAYYSGRIGVKGLIFMMIVVAVPAAYLMWASSNMSAEGNFLSSGTQVRGGVARHFKLREEAKSGIHERRGYIVRDGLVTDFALKIDAGIREKLFELPFIFAAGKVAGGSGGIVPAELRPAARDCIDVPLWKAELLATDFRKPASASAAAKFVLPYFRNGIWDAANLEFLGKFIEENPSSPTALRVEYARQLMHRGELTVAGDLLAGLKQNLEMLEKYDFVQTKDQLAAVNAALNELDTAKRTGASVFKLRVKLESGGMPVYGGIAGIQAMTHELPAESFGGDNFTDGGAADPPADMPEAKTSAEYLTQFHPVDENGEVEFSGLIGGTYRLIVFAESLGKPEPEYLSYPYVTGFPEYFEGGNSYYAVVHF